MNAPTETIRTPGDIVTEAASWLAMLGIVVMALFPFALPAIVLVIASLVPLLVLGLLGGLAAVLLAPPVLLARTMRRRRTRGRS